MSKTFDEIIKDKIETVCNRNDIYPGPNALDAMTNTLKEKMVDMSIPVIELSQLRSITEDYWSSEEGNT